MSVYRLQPNQIRDAVRTASTLYAPPASLTLAALACLAIGVLGFIVGLVVSPGHAWASLLANFLFWSGLSAASIAVMATFNIAHSWWGRTFERILTGIAAFLPFSLIPLIALWFGKGYLYWWVAEPGHNPWLYPVPVFVRSIVIVLLMSALAGWTLYRSLRPDVGAMIDEGRMERRGLAAFLTRGWDRHETEQVRTRRFLKTIAPVNILVYTVGYSILSVDLEMSTQPEFRSTMFPVIYFIGCYLAAFATAAVLTALWRRVETLRPLLAGQHVRDLGNMIWGASIFWAYCTFGQYFVFWMGNLPHEAEWHILRWRTMPWAVLAWVTLFITFIIPFLVLFARGVKWNPNRLALVALLPITGVLLNRFLHVYPSVEHFGVLGPTTFGLVEATVTLGFLGAVALCYLWLMRRVPLFPVEDPLYLHAVETRGVEV